jgi:hypothetical protein
VSKFLEKTKEFGHIIVLACTALITYGIVVPLAAILGYFLAIITKTLVIFGKNIPYLLAAGLTFWLVWVFIQFITAPMA